MASYLQEAERTKTNLFSDKKWNQDRVLTYAGQKQAVELGWQFSLQSCLTGLGKSKLRVQGIDWEQSS